MKFWFSKEKPASDEPEQTEKPIAPAAGEAVPVVAAGGASEGAPQKPVEPVPSPSVPLPIPRLETESSIQPMSNPKVNQRDLYCRLMNGLYDAILVLDSKGHVVDSNERVNAILGYTCDEMWDRPASEIIRGFGPRLLAQIAEPLDAHRPVIVDGHCVRSDGSVFSAEIAIGRVSLGRSENLVLSIRDVEKRIAAVIERLRKQGQMPAASARPKGLVRLVPSRTPEAGGSN